MNTIDLLPAIRLSDGRLKLAASLSYGLRKVNQYLIIDTDGLSDEQIEHTGDVWAILFLHKMMEIGGNFHIRSTLSQSLWRNLDYYVKAWCCFTPGEYHDISLTADELLDDTHAYPAPQALSCFSGGVDACFTAYRHAKKLAGPQSLPLQACLMVHGADIRLDFLKEWHAAVSSSREIIDDLGLPHFFTVETNFREMHCSYGLSYFSMLVACMRVFGKEYGYLMLGNDDHFSNNCFHSGNNPITNHFLSSRACEIVTDGAEFLRTDKASLLKNWPKALEKLRVCYQGEDLSRNCGRCNKCKRTMFNFLAVGVKALPCMPATSIQELLSIEINPIEHEELTLVMQYLEKHPLEPTPEWVPLLRDKLAMGPVQNKRKRGILARIIRHFRKKHR